MELHVAETSSYKDLATQAATALNLGEPGKFEKLLLFRANGTVIDSGSIATSFGEQPWSVKGYIDMVGSKVKIGLGHYFSVSLGIF